MASGAKVEITVKWCNNHGILSNPNEMKVNAFIFPRTYLTKIKYKYFKIRLRKEADFLRKRKLQQPIHNVI